ncbi:unnamed protein product [Linum trigynum]|uniref:Uncharacterized protein n=1 Tax=Linum trigynum TaxID=586398 RepID=A0AAV2GQS6_9ROSI
MNDESGSKEAAEQSIAGEVRRNDSNTQESVPRTHIRKVSTGRVGSSVVGTVIATCFTDEFSSSTSWTL